MRNSEFESLGVSANRNFILLTAIVVVIALSIRFTIANGDSLWLDELHTAWAVSDGLAEVGGRAADGNQNPLFFWLTWVCTQVLGPSDFSLRLVSVAAGTVLVGVAGWFTWASSRSLLGAAVTGLIITLDWRFVFYGTEARPYALMQLLGLLHAAIFANLIGWLPSPRLDRLSQSTKWSALTLLSIALFYCHITCIWLFAAEAIAVFLIGGTWVVKNRSAHDTNKASAEQPTFFRPLLLSVGAALVGCLPGVLNLSQVYGRKSNWSDISSPASVIADTREPLLFWIAIPLLLLAIVWIARKFLPATETLKPNHLTNTRLRTGQLSVFVLLLAITPIMGVIAVHCLNIAPLALSRYTVIGTTAMAIFAGLMISQFPNRLLKIIAIALIGWASYSNNEITQQLVNRQTLPVLRHENWDTPTDIVRTKTTDQQMHPQPLLLFANVIEDDDAATNRDSRFQEYLRFPVYNIRNLKSLDGRQVFPCPTHRSPRLSEEPAQGILKARAGWLLIRGSDATVQSIVKEVEATLSDHLPTESPQKIRIEEHNNDGDVVHLFSVDLL